MVFAALFNVDDKKLLKPESELDEVVVFNQGIELLGWEVCPQLLEIEPVGGFDKYVLKGQLSI